MPPQGSTAPKQLLQGNRVITARASRPEGDTDSKLDTIIKKLDERSESIDNLDKKVEELKKEVDRLKERRG
jgi:peptidoglycan hydrolase CwlO-like protein